MKLGAWTLVALLACPGCRTGTPGGPGARETGNKTPLIGPADDTFQVRAAELEIRRGETKPVGISVLRALNFDQDITLSLGELPRGVTADVTTRVVKLADEDARFVVTAADDASRGEFPVTITGHPVHGENATSELKIVVLAKKK